MRVKILSDNSAFSGDFIPEHGLSLWIEAGGSSVLYDLGQSGVLFRNAEKLNVDIASADLAVISHGHYDHCGGLERFLSLNGRAPVYLHEKAWEKHLSSNTGTVREIGMDVSLRANYHGRFVEIAGDLSLGPFYFLVKRPFGKGIVPSGNSNLFLQKGADTVPDDFDHEIIFTVDTGTRLVVFCGCSHQGVSNVIETVNEKFPGRAISFFFGGFHTANPRTGDAAENGSVLLGLASALNKYDVEKYYTGHCTGEKAYLIMKELMGDRLDLFAAGRSYDLRD